MRKTVQLAVAVRCSVSGNVLSDSGLRAAVEGSPVRMIRKMDGYALFSGLKNGSCTICLSHPGYHDAKIHAEIVPGRTGLEVVTMRPKYVDPDGAKRLTVKGLRPGSECFVAVQQMPFSLQGETEAGACELRLYRKTTSTLLIPCKVLCSDPEAPEVGILMDRTGADTWLFEKPLQKPHKRGTKFYPVQPYEADENGELHSLIFAEGMVSVFYDRKLYEFPVKEDTVWQIPL